MNRRSLLGVLGGTAGIAAAGLARAEPQGGAAERSHHAHSEPMYECAQACAEAVHHCMGTLKEGTPHRDVVVLVLQAADACKDFCLLSAQLEASQNPLMAIGHMASMEACKVCAEACDKAGKSSEAINRCGEACRKCEAHCRTLHHDHAEHAEHASAPAATEAKVRRAEPATTSRP